MLTSSDLENIKGIVYEVARDVVREELRIELTPIKKDIKSLKRSVKGIKEELVEIRGALNGIIKYSFEEVTAIKSYIGMKV